MGQPGGELPWLVLGAVGMLAGTVAVGWLGRDATTPRERRIRAVTVALPAVGVASYVSMALGTGLAAVPADGGTAVYWARYADWLFTTPLVLFDLALLAGADRRTVATLVGLDVLTVLAGVGGAAAGTAGPLLGIGPGVWRVLLFGVAGCSLAALLWLILGDLTRQAHRSGPAEGSFTTVRNLVVGLWVVSPVAWVLGTGATLGTAGPLGVVAGTALLTVLDLTAKVGFGVVVLRSGTTVDRRRDVTAATDTA
ncbi:rhodopsin [Halobacteriales archaeon QS_8_69_26]|nr:MAG: rhodopsin [Halobacteriales archaeon QS_8_69_26]